MASDKQIAANQRNARKSTGPKSKSGKARSSKNPFRHGLSVPMFNARSEELKDLSRQFAGDATDAESLVQAERAAHAQLDLTRIRSVQTLMIERVLIVGAERFPSDPEEHRLRFAQTDEPRRGVSPPHPEKLRPELLGSKGKDGAPAEVGPVLQDLNKIERYEKRAAARRDRAIGKIQNLKRDRL
jgi:hypothetical protein